MSSRSHTDGMTIGAIRYGSSREWFADPRSADRRMQVTCHGEAQRVVLSIWQGNACTATFQLPLADSPRLIAHLADCLSLGLADRIPDDYAGTDSRPTSALVRARVAVERWVTRLRRETRT